MKFIYAAAGAVVLADVFLVLVCLRGFSCQRCCRRWAVFSRQQMHVCRTCKRDIDRQYARPALEPKRPGA